MSVSPGEKERFEKSKATRVSERKDIVQEKNSTGGLPRHIFSPKG